MRSIIKYILSLGLFYAVTLNAGLEDLRRIYDGVRSTDSQEVQIGGLIQGIILREHPEQSAHFREILVALPMFAQNHQNTQVEGFALQALNALIEMSCEPGASCLDFLTGEPMCGALLAWTKQQLPEMRQAIQREYPMAAFEHVHTRYKEVAHAAKVLFFNKMMQLIFKWAQSQLGPLEEKPDPNLTRKDPPDDDPDGPGCADRSQLPVEATA